MGRFSVLRDRVGTDQEISLEPSSSPLAALVSLHQPQTNQAPQTLKLREIIVSPDRIRRYFAEAETQELADSIREFGFRGSIWVRRTAQGYELIAGGRRYAAAQLLGLAELPVDIIDNVSDLRALLLEMGENAQRRDLNPLEELEGRLRTLEQSLGISRSEVTALFHWHSRQLRQGGLKPTDNAIRKPLDTESTHPILSLLEIIESQPPMDDPYAQWQVVEAVFQLWGGKITPEGFRTNLLPLLNLPDSILSAVRAGQLEYSKARLIGRVKDETSREELLQQAITQGLTQSQIQASVRQLNAQLQANPRTGSDAASQEHLIHSRAVDIAKTLKTRIKTLNYRERGKVEKLLLQLEELLMQP